MRSVISSRTLIGSGVAGGLRAFLTVVAILTPTLADPGTDVAAAKVKCNNGGQIREVGRGWSKIRQPQHSALDEARGYTGIQRFTADPGDAERIYATNRLTLWRTDDGGCTWKEVWHIREAEASHRAEVFGTINQIYVPPEAPRGVVYMSTDSSNLYPPVVHLLKSTDSGVTWSLLDGNFPNGMVAPDANVGTAYPTITSAPSDPSVLYFSVKSGIGSGGVWWLYVSKNAGKTWATTFDPVGPAVARLGQNQTQFMPVVDPLDPKDVWVYNAFEVIHSTDGGATWAVVVPGVTDFGKGARDLEVFHQKGKPAQILVVPNYNYRSQETRRIFRSDNGGKTFFGVITPDEVHNVEFGKTLDTAIISTDRDMSGPRVFRFDRRSFNRGKFPWTEITAPGYGGRYLTELDVGGRKNRSYYWRTGEYAWMDELILWRYDGKV